MGTAAALIREPFNTGGPRSLGQRLAARFAPACARGDCQAARTVWQRFGRRHLGMRLHGHWYCSPECLEHALSEILAGMASVAVRKAPAAHRLPLGLLLLSRQQLTANQLRTALAAQQTAGYGKLGEWLQQLGFVGEQAVTAALATQWACPVLRVNEARFRSPRVPQLPLVLLEWFRAIPVDFAEATATLLLAFRDSVEYSFLYAIEQILGCHTEACLISPTAFQNFCPKIFGDRPRTEVVFDRVERSSELIPIIGSYVRRVTPSDIRIATCLPYIWVRLERLAREPVDLVLRLGPGRLVVPIHTFSAVGFSEARR